MRKLNFKLHNLIIPPPQQIFVSLWWWLGSRMVSSSLVYISSHRIFLSVLQITVPLIIQRNAILVRFKAGGEGDNRGWDGWMASPTQWTWVWVDSSSWWWDKEAWHAAVHGVAKSRTWLTDWTELNWNICLKFSPNLHSQSHYTGDLTQGLLTFFFNLKVKNKKKLYQWHFISYNTFKVGHLRTYWDTEREGNYKMLSWFIYEAPQVVLVVKNMPPMQEMQEMSVWSLDQEDPLEKGMAAHS